MALFNNIVSWLVMKTGRGQQIYCMVKPRHSDYAEFLRRHRGATIGDNTTVNPLAQFMDGERVRIGKNCSVSSAVFVTHSGGDRLLSQSLGRHIDSCIGRNIVVEDGCVIGAAAMIGPGVRIGAGSIIGFGACVREDVPPGSVVIGNPARVIGRRDDYVARIERRTAGWVPPAAPAPSAQPPRTLPAPVPEWVFASRSSRVPDTAKLPAERRRRPAVPPERVLETLETQY